MIGEKAGSNGPRASTGALALGLCGGTCFRLNHRQQTATGPSITVSRATVMTRGGIDSWRQQLNAECLRHGLGKAAVTCWSLPMGRSPLEPGADRFGTATQRLDFYHASQHLWAVAHALHPQDAWAAHQWIEPLLKKLKAGRSLKVIAALKAVTKRLRSKRRARRTI